MATIVRRQPRGCPEPVYYYHETYRVKVNPSDRGKGPGSGKSKVKSRDVYLGTAKQILEKIQAGQRPREIHKKQFGLVCAALSVAEEIGLVEVIDRHVPKRRQGLSVGQYILIAVLNKIAHPTSRNGIRDWIQRTVLPEKLGIDPGLLRSQNFWDNFDLILSEEDVRTQKERLARAKIDEDELFSDEVILKIEEGIWERVCERYQIPLDCVLYDTTNFFTFISSGTDSFLARTGRNKHARHNLRQVGLALAVIQGCELPFLHLLYHGRRSDAKLFPEAMTDLVSRYLALSKGVRKLTVVFDKGNNSRANLQRASELNLRVVGSLVPAHHQDLVRVSLDRYVQIEGRLCYVTRKEVFGIPAKVVVSYNEATYRRQSRRLKAKVEALREEIREYFRSHKDQPKSELKAALHDILQRSDYGRYLLVEVEGRRHKRLVCRINLKAYRAKLRTFGKTILFTNDLEMPTEELINLYRSKNEVERQFRQLNDPEAIAFRPMYHWTDSKIKVYALICVLALLVLQLMNYRARTHGLRMSNSILRAELADIEEVVLLYSLTRVVKQLSSMSTVQRTLFEIFDLGRYAPT